MSNEKEPHSGGATWGAHRRSTKSRGTFVSAGGQCPGAAESHLGREAEPHWHFELEGGWSFEKEAWCAVWFFTNIIFMFWPELFVEYRYPVMPFDFLGGRHRFLNAYVFPAYGSSLKCKLPEEP